ncbi:MAG: PucR family transcriptional regulator [Bacillota bacterium]
MGITVREALKIGGLRDARIIAGFIGMDREIEHVTVMEVPDIIQWLKGNELILTSGFAISKDEEEQTNLIKGLADKGVSALVIKTQRFLDLIPKAMAEAANDYQLPLIELDYNISYIDIIRPIITEIINREITSFQRQLTEVADTGGSIEQRLAILWEYVMNPIAVLDKKGDVLAEYPQPWVMKSPVYMKIQKAEVPSEMVAIHDGISYYVFPLKIEGCIEGYLVLSELQRKIDESVILLVKGSLSIFNIDLLQRKTMKDIMEGFRSDFLEDLLLGHIKLESVARRRANFLGYPEAGSFVVAIVMGQTEPFAGFSNFRRKVARSIESQMDDKMSLLELIEGKNLVFLLHLKKADDFTPCLMGLQNILKDSGLAAFSMGVGEIFTKLTETRKSFLEATEALEFGNEFWGVGSCTFFSDIGIYRLLWTIKEHVQLDKYVHQGLLDLIKYDKEQNTELLRTLETYLKNAGNSKKTSAEMFIHYKTLQYRLERIGEIAKIDFSSGESRLEFHLGLKILDVCNKRGSC